MDIKKIRAKFAEAKEQLETNEEESTVGTANLHKDPDGRETDEDALWGEKGPEDPNVHTKKVETEAKDERVGVLDRSFDSFQSASQADKALIGQNFQGAASSEAHSPLLKKSSFTFPTVLERVKRVTGMP